MVAELQQAWPAYAPMRQIEAAAFVLLGLVVLARLIGWRAAEWLGFLPMIWAVPALAYGLSTATERRPPGSCPTRSGMCSGCAARLAILTASCVLLGSIPLWLHALKPKSRFGVFCEAAVGSLLVGAAVSAILGYQAGQTTVFDWGDGAPISPTTAAGLLLLGLCLLDAGVAGRPGGRTRGVGVHDGHRRAAHGDADPLDRAEGPRDRVRRHPDPGGDGQVPAGGRHVDRTPAERL